MQCVTGDIPINIKLRRQVWLHCAIRSANQPDIRMVKPMELSRARNCVSKWLKRYSNRIENCSFSLAVFRYEHCEVRMQFNRTVDETPEVVQMQPIEAQTDGVSHCFRPRSRSALISKLIEDTPQPGSASN